MILEKDVRVHNKVRMNKNVLPRMTECITVS